MFSHLALLQTDSNYSERTSCSLYNAMMAQKVSHYQDFNSIKNRQWSYIFHQFWVLNEQKILQVCIKYSKCDLIVTSSVTTFEAAIPVKSIYMTNYNWKSKKEKIWILNTFFNINIHLKDGLRMEFTACWD